MRAVIVEVACLGLLAAPCMAAEIERLDLSSDLSYGYGSELEQSMQGQLDASPGIEIRLSTSGAFVGSARVRLDARDELEPGRAPLDTYADASRPLSLGTTGTVELRDFYLEFVNAGGLARFGKQQIAWGRLDGIKVLDLVNPQDFREFILEDFSDSRISLWSAYFDYSLGDWRAEFAVIPDSTGHAIPNPGAWFELTAPRFRFGASPGQPGLPVVTEKPTHALDRTAAGLRLSRRIGTAEIGLVAYSGMDPEPLGRIGTVAGRPVLERFYERRDAIGFSLDMGLGGAVLRAEYAFQPDRVFNVRSAGVLATAELDQHRGAIGLDIDAPLGLFINFQYLVDTIAAPPVGLVRPERDRIGTLFLRRAFGYDRVILEARWYQSFTDDDRLATVSIEYAFNGNTSIRFAANAFDGVPTGLFGQFDSRDRLILTLEHTF
jgi:hypothetical protein